jgi:hypothetical protein
MTALTRRRCYHNGLGPTLSLPDADNGGFGLVVGDRPVGGLGSRPVGDPGIAAGIDCQWPVVK